MNRVFRASVILVCCVPLLLLAAIPATAGVTERVSVSSNGEEENSGALYFDGIDDYASMWHSPDLDMTGSPFTIEAWVKPKSSYYNGRIVEKLGFSSGEGQYWLYCIGNFLVGGFNGPSGLHDCGGAELPVEQWSYVAVVVDGNTIRVYVNGSLRGLTNTPAEYPVSVPQGPLLIGCYREYYDYFDGTIDELRIWRIARSQQQLQSAMFITLDGDEPGLVGYWRFDEGGGQYINDSSLHGNIGILGSVDSQDLADPVWVSATHNGTPPVGVPGWESGEGTTFDVCNPYNISVQRRVKGQLHCHYYNDAEYEWGPFYAGMAGVGSWFPINLMNSYKALGYDFVCVTEHNHCTSDPLYPYAKYMRYCEEVTNGFGHVVAIGVEEHGSWLPRWDEKRYLPWDIPNNLREVIETSPPPSSVSDVVNEIKNRGGLAIVAHPNAKGPWLDRVSADEISNAKPNAMSIYTAACRSNAVDVWKDVLKKKTFIDTDSGRMLMFGATEDDFTPVVGYQGFGRTWIVAELDSTDASQENIINALKNGRYWNYWSKRSHSGTEPILSLSVSYVDGKPKITVTSDTDLDDIRFMGLLKDVGEKSLPLIKPSSKEAYYTCTGSENYIRVEASCGDIHIYSQPINITEQWSSGSSSGSDNGAQILSSPSDLVLTLAQPEELPEVMPPLGYIGRAYFASTTSGTYPPDGTLTLSYQGQDVTPYGSSNLAIYRWDSASNSWLKLTSTIDIGNALVTAPLAQAGLYTISAEIIDDTTAPEVIIHTPSDGATLTGPDTIGVQATDNVGVLRASFYLNDQQIGVDSTSYDGFTCDYDFGKKSAGPYTLKVAAEDVTGNVGEAEIAVNISSSGVTPTVAITSHSNGANLMMTTTVSGTCSDDALVTGVFIMVDGMPVGEASVNDGMWSYQLNPSEFADGPHSLSAMVMDEDQNTYEQGISVNIEGTNLPDLSLTKTLPDGERARVSGRIVTLGDPSHEGAFYIEEADRFAGIRVEGSMLPTEGDMVSVSGLMTTLGGERSLVGADVHVISSSNPVPPALGMTNLRLGGSPVGLLTPGVNGGRGLNNIGLLVRVWGKVTQIGDDYLYIDDGSKLKDGTLTGEEENIGVRVICDPTGHNEGDFLIVTGISSCFETPSGQIAKRVIKLND